MKSKFDKFNWNVKGKKENIIDFASRFQKKTIGPEVFSLSQHLKYLISVFVYIILKL